MFDSNLGLQDLADCDAQAIVGGPTAVEYAVMLALIIVVCKNAVKGSLQSGSLADQLQ